LKSQITSKKAISRVSVLVRSEKINIIKKKKAEEMQIKYILVSSLLGDFVNSLVVGLVDFNVNTGINPLQKRKPKKF